MPLKVSFFRLDDATTLESGTLLVTGGTAALTVFSLVTGTILAASFGGSGGWLDSVLAVPAETSGWFEVALRGSCALLSGRAICEDIMAGSTGAPGTVGWPVGARLAGGVYLFCWLGCNGGYSAPFRRTPLYLPNY